MKYFFYLVCITLFVCIIYLLMHPEELIPDFLKHKEKVGMSMTFLDIGQGDATYIQFENGEDMLIDCAIDGRILEALGRVMSWRDRTIDYLIVTHPDFDHYGGCEEVLDRFEVKHIVYNGLVKNDTMWKSFWGAVKNEEGEYIELQKQTDMEIASTTISLLYPDHSIAKDSKVPGLDKDTGANDTSIVAKLVHGKTTILLMGDTEEPLEHYLDEVYGEELDADILKLGHHGSDSSSSEEFLEMVTPHDAIVSAGKNNTYGHPSLRVLKRLERTSTTVWRTDRSGDITLQIDAHEYTVSTER